MKKKLVFVLGIVALGSMLLWAGDDQGTLQSARFAQLTDAPLAQTSNAGEFSNVNIRNPSGISVVTAGWFAETTAFANRGDRVIRVGDFNGNLRTQDVRKN